PRKQRNALQRNALVPFTWIEHVASPLPRECSTTELKGLTCRPRRLRASDLKTGAGEGNRTLVLSLEGFSSTIELHPRGLPASPNKPAASILFPRTFLVEGAGFEPAYS